jgi:hypothetical protein
VTSLLCSRCRGSGRVRLATHLERTLALVRDNPGATATQLASMACVRRTTMCERLALLFSSGLVVAERDGLANTYHVKGGAK